MNVVTGRREAICSASAECINGAVESAEESNATYAATVAKTYATTVAKCFCAPGTHPAVSYLATTFGDTSLAPYYSTQVMCRGAVRWCSAVVHCSGAVQRCSAVVQCRGEVQRCSALVQCGGAVQR